MVYKMKGTLQWKHETDKTPSAEATFETASRDVVLRATVTDASILNKGPSLGVVLALKKTDAFAVDYHVLKRKMKGTLQWKHETDKTPSAEAKFKAAAGDVVLRATVTDASILNKGPSLEGVVLALKKPDAFAVDYHVLKRDCNFKFKNTIKVSEKPLKLKYKHKWCSKDTDLNGTLELDNANKVSADCTFGSEKIKKCKLNYIYDHKGLTTLKPSYEVVSDSWDFAVSQKLYGINTLEASYKTSEDNKGTSKTSSKILGLKWSLESKPYGSFEINASLNLGEKLKVPTVSAKTTFKFEI